MADGTTVTSLPHTVFYAVVDLHEGVRGTENPIIEPCSELSRLRALLAQAEKVLVGKVRHRYAGGCPDETNGWASLDPACPACRVLAAIREEPK